MAAVRMPTFTWTEVPLYLMIHILVSLLKGVNCVFVFRKHWKYKKKYFVAYFKLSNSLGVLSLLLSLLFQLLRPTQKRVFFNSFFFNGI